ncbi:MAG: AAA family ATPase [Bacteroidales bacterium]|nr:AAA family ATPase [Bacteroidales bacterium]
MKNFLSYGNNITEFKLNNSQVSVITGENGRGKSCLTDALYFGLTGKPFRSVNKNELVNTKNKKDCLVEIEFSVGQDSYLVKRGIKPNLFEIFKNNELIDESSHVRDYQEVLESITGLTKSTIEQTLIISNRFYKPFLELSASEKRSFIETVFGLDMLTSMNDSLKIRLSEAKQSEQFNEKDIERIDSNVNILTEQIQSQNKINNTQEIENKIKESENVISEHMEVKRKLECQINELVKQKQDCSDKIKNFDVYNKKLILCEKNVNEIIKQLKFFSDNNECPTCQQNLDSMFIERKKTKLFEEESLWKDRYEVLNKKIDNFKKVKENINELDNKIYKLQLVLNSAKVKISNEQKRILDLKNEVVKQGIHESDNQEKLLRLKTEKENLLEKKLELAKQKRLIQSLQKLISDKGIRRYIVGKYIPVINEFIRNYLEILSASYQLKFDEEFNENILTYGSTSLNYGGFSSGEKQRCDLALIFSFLQLAKSKNNVSCNLICFDEKFHDLDNEGLSGLKNIFDILKSLGYTIVLITHDNRIKELGDRNFVVTKDKFSRINEQ